MELLETIATIDHDELPKGWALKTIDQLIGDDGLFIDGDWIESKDQDPNGDVRLIQLSDIGDGEFRNRSDRYLTSQSAKELSCTYLKTGDVLIARMPEPLGRACVFPGVDQPAITAVDVAIIRGGKEGFDPQWFMYFVNAPYFRAAINRLQSGTTRKRISRKNLGTLELPAPPLSEQRRVVEAIELQLGRLDEAVASLQAAKTRLKRYKQAVLKAAVEGRLTEEWREKNAKKLPSAEQVIADLKKARDEAYRQLKKVERSDGERQVRKPKDIEPITEDELATLPELPENWAYARVGNAVNDIFDGPFGSHLKSVDYIDAGVRVIRLENIVFLGFRDDLKSYVSVEKYNTIRNHTVGAGDIIFSSFINEQTRVAVLPDHIDLAINKSDCFCVRIDNVPMNRNYVQYFLSSDLAYSQLVHGIHGATRPRINTTQLKQCPIPVCSLEEQREIARLVGKAMAAADETEASLEAQLQQAVRLRQSVLKQAFEGRLV